MSKSEPAADAREAGTSRASRGMIRTRLLQARARAESDWASWSDKTAADLIAKPPLTRLRELHAHQGDLTATAWYRVAESLINVDVPAAATPRGAEAPMPLTSDRRPSGPARLPWDRQVRRRSPAEPAGARPPARVAAEETFPGTPVRRDDRGAALPDRAAGPPAVARDLRAAGLPARAAPPPAHAAQGSYPRPAPALVQANQTDGPDLVIGALAIVGLLLCLYWLFSERIL